MKYYVSAYDKLTGLEVNSFSISESIYKEVLQAMEISYYADGHSLNSEGIMRLHSLGLEIEPKLFDYQVEVCCD